MIKIFIQGLKDGVYDFELNIPVSSVPEMSEEFFGEIEIEGKFRKLRGRITVEADAECQVKLICDRSLTEFTDLIEVDVKLSYISESAKDASDSNTEELIFNSEEKYLNITKEVLEIFSISLPMKRIAPKFRGKSIEEIYPDMNKKDEVQDEIVDDRWAALKNVKIN